ncbi:MAG: hypothetical protein ACK4GJ_00635 [bacterium]
MSIEKFEGTIAYFVISRLAGGEVLESYSPDSDVLQNILEYSINIVENFQTLKVYNGSLIGKLNYVTMDYEKVKVFLVEIKEEDIYVVALFSSSYPSGIAKLFLDEYLNYVRQTYGSL